MGDADSKGWADGGAGGDAVKRVALVDRVGVSIDDNVGDAHTVGGVDTRFLAAQDVADERVVSGRFSDEVDASGITGDDALPTGDDKTAIHDATDERVELMRRVSIGGGREYAGVDALAKGPAGGYTGVDARLADGRDGRRGCAVVFDLFNGCEQRVEVFGGGAARSVRCVDKGIADGDNFVDGDGGVCGFAVVFYSGIVGI